MPKKTVSNTSADPTVDYVDLELDGHTYHLCFDFNAIATAESLDTGVNLLSALDLQGMTARQLRGIFYSSLLKAHPKMTLEQVGSLITFPTFLKINDAIAEAWIAAFPPAKESEKNEQSPETGSE